MSQIALSEGACSKPSGLQYATTREESCLSPRTVIRGETAPPSDALAHVDWLSFTVVPPDQSSPLLWLIRVLQEVFAIPPDCWDFTDRGWQGYESRADLDGLGLVAYGGKDQRGTYHVSLNAKACALIPDWQKVFAFGLATRSKLKRIDLAHDDFDSETISVDVSLKWHREGGFSHNGRPPKAHLIDDLGSGEGRTLNVGHRRNGKLSRTYEKGKQLGDKKSRWSRIELELRNKGRMIPWETVLHPGAYLAGGYPCLAFLSLEQSKIKTVQRTYEITYDEMREWVFTAAGRALHAMCEVEHGDASAVLSQVMREGLPKRLKGIPLPKQLPR